jgi:hypothetical protein
MKVLHIQHSYKIIHLKIGTLSLILPTLIADKRHKDSDFKNEEIIKDAIFESIMTILDNLLSIEKW